MALKRIELIKSRLGLPLAQLRPLRIYLMKIDLANNVRKARKRC